MRKLHWITFGRLLIVQALTIGVFAHASTDADVEMEFRSLAKQACQQLKNYKEKLAFSADQFCKTVHLVNQIRPTNQQLFQDGRPVDAKNWRPQMDIDLYSPNWLKRSAISRLQLTIHEIMGLAEITDLNYVASTQALVALGYIVQAENLSQAHQQLQNNMSGLYTVTKLNIWKKKSIDAPWVLLDCQVPKPEVEPSRRLILKIEHFAAKIRILQSVQCYTKSSHGDYMGMEYVSYSDGKNPFFTIDNGKLKFHKYQLGTVQNGIFDFRNEELAPGIYTTVKKEDRILKVSEVSGSRESEFIKIEAEMTEDISALEFFDDILNDGRNSEEPEELRQ